MQYVLPQKKKKKIVVLFKETKVGAEMQLRESDHEEVRECHFPSDTGKKWRLYDPSDQLRHSDLTHPDNRLRRLLLVGGSNDLTNWEGAIKVDFGVIGRCEGAVENRELVGRVRQGRLGVEFAGGEKGRRYEQLSVRQRMVRAVRQECEAERLAKAFTQKAQCSWVGWTNYNQKWYSWKSLAYGDPKLWRFGLGATYDTLSSPSNLKRWHVAADDKCYLCGEKGTLNHSLSGCSVALGQQRYRYRHDNVLKVICHHLVCFMKNRPRVQRSQDRSVRFVSAGIVVGRQRSSRRGKQGLLFGADDWEFLCDVGKRLVFPPHIVSTLQRPDIVIYSNAQKTIIMIELTCPSEFNFQKNNEFKLNRYNNLRADCEKAGWKCHLFAVEVGARGYTAQSLTSCLKALGLRQRSLRRCLEEAGYQSLRRRSGYGFLGRMMCGGKWDFLSVNRLVCLFHRCLYFHV